MQIRLNSYRAFHPIMDLSTQQKYYNFFPNLIEMSKEEKYCKTFSMTPDVCLIVNNWRLLHGRQSYILQVCYLVSLYIEYKDWLNTMAATIDTTGKRRNNREPKFWHGSRFSKSLVKVWEGYFYLLQDSEQNQR